MADPGNSRREEKALEKNHKILKPANRSRKKENWISEQTMEKMRKEARIRKKEKSKK